MNNLNPRLELKNISKRFGPVEALVNVSMTVNSGEVVALLGDNGAGKSTLIKILSGVYRQDQGELNWEGKNVAILSLGTRLQECLKASESLNQKGISVTIADMRFAKPIDEDLILELCSNHEALITIEEGSIGGFGSHVIHFASSRGILDKGIKLRSMILPDVFIDQDTPENMYKKAGLDAHSIEEKILEALKSNIILSKKKSIN